jgi:hypothetical protein
MSNIIWFIARVFGYRTPREKLYNKLFDDAFLLRQAGQTQEALIEFKRLNKIFPHDVYIRHQITLMCADPDDYN